MTDIEKHKRDEGQGGRNIGRLLVIGGNEDKDEDNMVILPHFVEMCGGSKARIVVCGAPSASPEEKERTYKKLFLKIGAADVYEANVTERPEGEDEELLLAVKKATGVFFTGGDQMRLTSLVAGTAFGEEIRHRLWNEGLVVGGTSAGAAAMSSTMITGGSDRGTVRRADVRLAPGLGYWRDTVIDTHFAQRGRVSRLLVIFAQNPQVLGIGIDEDTAVEVQPGKRFSVVGTGACFVFDGTVTHTNAPDVGDDEVIAMTDSLSHVLPSGYGFDLHTKRPILPEGEVIDARASA
ncbi:MAG TPA: cyanophycinase [Thermoanaerobaculia bacterium]